MGELSPNECFKAKLLRTAFDIPPADIPEDFEAVRFQDRGCLFVGKDAKDCNFANPMIFLKRDVGFVAMGSRNFCRLEGDSPREFKRASLGGVAVRAMRLGRDVLALVKRRWTPTD